MSRTQASDYRDAAPIRSIVADHEKDHALSAAAAATTSRARDPRGSDPLHLTSENTGIDLAKMNSMHLLAETKAHLELKDSRNQRAGCTAPAPGTRLVVAEVEAGAEASSDHRRAARHRLEDRHREPFGAVGKDAGVTGAVERGRGARARRRRRGSGGRARPVGRGRPRSLHEPRSLIETSPPWSLLADVTGRSPVERPTVGLKQGVDALARQQAPTKRKTKRSDSPARMSEPRWKLEPSHRQDRISTP